VLGSFSVVLVWPYTVPTSFFSSEASLLFELCHLVFGLTSSERWILLS
jgi:hypothetical protein